jgi:hypothetical protein
MSSEDRRTVRREPPDHVLVGRVVSELLELAADRATQVPDDEPFELVADLHLARRGEHRSRTDRCVAEWQGFFGHNRPR